ncbi:MAG: GreA/GreB family elongation factor, partial [Bdellovibrionales bacterium]
RNQVFFGATVTFLRKDEKLTVTIVGIDEANMAENKISWLSPVARALMKARPGDEVELKTPSGKDVIEVLEVRYINSLPL